MEYAPICIATLNRYMHLKNCIESLKKNSWAKHTELFIALDYPPNSKYKTGYKEVCRYLEMPIEGFKKVTIIKREYNYGCEKNFLDLFDQVLEKFNSYIAMEDDCIVAPDFIEYMDKCMDYFKDSGKVCSVAGYTKTELYSEGSNVAVSPRYAAWGHGVWKATHYKMKKEVSIEYFERYARSIRHLFRFKSAREFSRFIDMIFAQEVPSWDISYSIWMQVNDLVQIRPLRTKIVNRGNDSSALHPEAIISEAQTQELESGNMEYDICVGSDLYDRRIIKKNTGILCDRYIISKRKCFFFLIYFLLGKTGYFKLVHYWNCLKK